MAKRKAGLSTSMRVRLSSLTDSGLHVRVSNLTQVRRARLESEREREERNKSLTRAAIRTLAENALEAGVPEQDVLNDNDYTPSMDTSFADDDDEGEGEGEDEEKFDGLRDAAGFEEGRRQAVIDIGGSSRPRKRVDQRTRQLRNRRLHASWSLQIEKLVDAYLLYKHGSPPANEEAATRGDAPHSTSLDHVDGQRKGTSAAVTFFHVTAVEIKECESLREVEQRHDELANVSLIRAGFLGCSPTQPTIAISLDCLELYHQIRRHKSSFSTQTMAKVLCSLHNVTYLSVFREQLSIAFDVYLDILRRVHKRVKSALQRDSPTWRLEHACPPCSHKLKDEPTLIPARLHAMDGNNSLKRLDGAGHTDDRIFESDYRITPADVDRFKDDVRMQPGKHHGAPPNTDDDDQVDEGLTVNCADNWKAAGVVREDTVTVFEQTGVFVGACRHGIIETLVEMRRSGELAKYALATVDKLLDVFGDHQGIGHDIACSFKTTLANSSIAQKAASHKVLMAVNAFHGYAHNRLCQLSNHPLYLEGLGLEDLETCERIFSASNAVASTVRYASHYHWLQFIDLHFDQWDQDRYSELSKFLYNNYKQALSIISEYTPQIEAFKAARGIQDDTFEQWRHEEFEYLTKLKEEPQQDVYAVAYVEALDALRIAEAKFTQCSGTQFVDTYSPEAFRAANGRQPKQRSARQLIAERNGAQRRLQIALTAVESLERDLEIDVRWTEDTESYRRASDYVKNRRFIRAVEELERLVVQRIFELDKANLAQTGYKMRRHISKALVRRSGAIRSALEHYNQLAPIQNPPRPKLQYHEVVSYGWLGEFELLKHSRHDLLAKPWAAPANRAIAAKYFKLKSAHGEIHRLNVEVPRLQDWIDSEDKDLLSHAERLSTSQPFIAAEIRDMYSHRHRVNNVHRHRLQAIYSLTGYTGPRPIASPDSGQDRSILKDLEGEDIVLPDEDDTLNDETNRLQECLRSFTL